MRTSLLRNRDAAIAAGRKSRYPATKDRPAAAEAISCNLGVAEAVNQTLHNTLESLLGRIKGADVEQLVVILKDYGIDLWGLVRDQFGTSTNGRSAAFELQAMSTLNVPSGLVSVTRRPGS